MNSHTHEIHILTPHSAHNFSHWLLGYHAVHYGDTCVRIPHFRHGATYAERVRYATAKVIARHDAATRRYRPSAAAVQRAEVDAVVFKEFASL